MDDPKIAIIIPTFNEKGNLETLLRAILSLNIKNLEILVIDDNSEDGTGKIAENFSKRYPVKLISRPRKLGLGTAYVAGFREILKSNPNFIIQMDADLSHDPKAIPEMLEKIKNADAVVGSRYIKNGKIENWDWTRKMISRFGNFYARIVLSLPYKDLTSGYKCWRKKVIENLKLDALDSIGYNFQIETIFFAHHMGFKIMEIPITFSERKVGASKFNFAIIKEAFLKVLLLRFRKKPGTLLVKQKVSPRYHE